jgi:hypothetical protein
MSNAMSALMAAVSKAKQSGGSEREEDVFYYPERDAAGNGSAILRFLPATTNAEAPFVKVYSHGFQGPTKKWFIDNCPTTLGDDCPVCAANSELYAKMSKEDARKHGLNRKVSFIARVLVIEDKKTPSNEGKVFLYKFGQKIFNKIVDALEPTDEDDVKLNVFGVDGDTNPWTNFKLKIRVVEKQVNYDKSEFEKEGDDVDVDFRAQFNEVNNIMKFIDPSKFKDAEALQKRLDFVLGNTTRTATSSPKKESNVVDDEDDGGFEQVKEKKSEPKRTEVKKSSSNDDEDDILAMMAALAED